MNRYIYSYLTPFLYINKMGRNGRKVINNGWKENLS